MPSPSERRHGAEVPIFIICRDKVTPLQSLVTWLANHGHHRIILVDNNSSYPPLLEYLEATEHTVVRLRENLGPWKSVWGTGVRDRYAKGEYYAVSDSDVVPDAGCPGDAMDLFSWALRRYPRYLKAGFGLRIDDLPSHYALADEVRRWEGQWSHHPLGHGLYDAQIDTTFALYRPDSAFAWEPAIRTGAPYLARHTPWYADSARRTDEDQYYIDHSVDGFTHWDSAGHTEAPPGSPSVPQRIRWRVRVLVREETNKAVPRSYKPNVLRKDHAHRRSFF